MSKIEIIPLIDTIKYLEISDNEYFGSDYVEYISNSKLSLINPDQGGSPEKYLEGLGGLFSDSLIFGSAVHELILQPEEFELCTCVNRPTAKLGYMADELYKSYLKNKTFNSEDIVKASNKIDYYKGKMNFDKINAVTEKCTEYIETRYNYESELIGKEPIYLDAKSRIKLKDCLKSINQNSQIKALLKPFYLDTPPISQNEAVLLMDVLVKCDDKEKVLHLKAKLDNFTIDLETHEVVLNDLKTTGHFLDDFKDSFAKYHYARQMAMYIWLLDIYVRKIHNIIPTKLSCNMLLVSTVPTYDSKVFPVSGREIQNGFNEFSKLLKMVAYYELFGYEQSGIKTDL